MRAESEEAWVEREQTRAVVHGSLAIGSAFRALQKACRKFREVMQAAEDKYLEVYFGGYGHLKGGWRLQGKRVGSAQYIRDEDGKLQRELEKTRERWSRYSGSVLNTTSAALDRRGSIPQSGSPVTQRPAGLLAFEIRVNRQPFTSSQCIVAYQHMLPSEYNKTGSGCTRLGLGTVRKIPGFVVFQQLFLLVF